MSELAPVVDLDALIAFYKSDPEASARMTCQKWVEWAVRCAERALPSYEDKYPDDNRPREALLAARAWVASPTKENQRRARTAADAANAAGYAAVYAGYAAGYAAAHAAAHTAHAAAYAAHAAAHAAAYAAYAAYAAERQWQAFQLMDVYHGETNDE